MGWKAEAEKRYCVYKHISPNGKIYIGITHQNPINRWENGHGYANNRYFTAAIKKYGWNNFKHEILLTGLHYSQALQEEISLIAEYKSNNKDYGYNITIGGDAPMLGRCHSEKTKERLSITHSGANHPNYGKHLSLETKKKISVANTGKIHSKETREKLSKSHAGKQTGEDNPFYGKTFSRESLMKLKNSLILSEKNKKPVLQIDKNGEIIGRFPSLKRAKETTGINSGHISSVCTGKRKSAGGYGWRYA